MKRLYRSSQNKVILGVFGGLGEYFDIDPVIIRLIFILVLFATGIIPLIIGYFIAALIVPQKT